MQLLEFPPQKENAAHGEYTGTASKKKLHRHFYQIHILKQGKSSRPARVIPVVVLRRNIGAEAAYE